MIEQIGQTTILPTDTIISLSTRLLGDPTRWLELVTLNALKAPYVHPAGGQGVLKPGDTIRYPLASDAVTFDVPVNLFASTYRRDLVTQDGDLVIEGNALATASGLENYVNALRRRVSMTIGTHPFHAEFGSLLRFHVGESGDQARLKLLTNDLLRAIMQDPRTATVRAALEFRGNTVYAVAEVTPIPPGDTFTLDLPLF